MSDSGFETELLDLLRSGHKIEAIKLYRQQTGQGLAESKAAVERLERDGELPERHPSITPEIEAEVMALLGRGSVPDAVRLVRERTGMSLHSARQLVEQTATKLGIRVSDRPGCFNILLLAMALGGGSAVLLFVLVSR